ncbi:hypothetical protein [Streptomyces sp. 11x1]|uniref:hypothetical protein n=1 Tax=Streptomyces sp. 11x1 TaxID=3038642 RepID=UPI00292DFFD5|nr:hypothetical protein [Streptomyces sp. 11x1]WNZ08239.1 hypothetical protein P8T65_12010 [Streptomyces sp. 11x1]
MRTLGTHPGVRLITATEPTVEEFTEALEAGGGPRVVMVDDADLFVPPDIDQNLRSLAQSGRDHGIGIVVAATAETMTGATGWLSALKRHRKGVLLGPQSILEGDFVGARLAHAHLRGRKPGRVHRRPARRRTDQRADPGDRPRHGALSPRCLGTRAPRALP